MKRNKSLSKKKKKEIKKKEEIKHANNFLFNFIAYIKKNAKMIKLLIGILIDILQPNQ